MTQSLQLAQPLLVNIVGPDSVSVRGFSSPEPDIRGFMSAPDPLRRWPWKSRELTAPPGLWGVDDPISEVTSEGDYAWLDADMDGFGRTAVAGNRLDSAIYLNRIARLHMLRGDSKAARAAASAAYPHLSGGQGPSSEESLFCEETIALAGYGSWGWSRTSGALADIALRSARHLGPLAPQTLRAISGRAALAAETGVRALARELYADLVHRDIRLLGSSHRFTLADRICLAAEAGLAGDRAYALGLARACESEAASGLGESHPLRCMAMRCAGEILAAGGDFGEATSVLSAAAELHAEAFGPDHERTLDCAGALASALNRSGHPDLAEKVLKKAVDDLERNMETCSREAEEAWERLLTMQEEMGFAGDSDAEFWDRFA
ncbi:MAG: tetratricopeptide repeat protein [Deltaproteobacteria bacterium]|jgi:hypothetical protein|nr:tetratricopeptide repeat protein [Deltaproteobacteria bacterium]